MRVLVSGSTGLIGTALLRDLQRRGDEVLRLVRTSRDWPEQAVQWRPDEDALSPDSLEGLDAVVHLAGESIAQRWTRARKKRIWHSRVDSTRLLVEALGQIRERPRVLLCASAVGYYGDGGDAELTEDGPPGSDFLGRLCVAWESAARAAEDLAIRVVNLRFGVVLSHDGGALGKMLPLFRMGLGGRLGSGRQFMSWVHIDDAVGGLVHSLHSEQLSGPLNVTSPNPLRNKGFAETLGSVLGRPAFVPTPAWVLRLGLGEMAGPLLASVRAVPARLAMDNYQFVYPRLDSALHNITGSSDRSS